MADSFEGLIAGHRDVLTVKRVFGEAFERDGVTVIPAARVVGGGGGGAGESPDGTGQGMGTGFGMIARPAGAYVIKGDQVSWQPAVDVNRIVAGALALAAFVVFIAHRNR